MKILHISDLHLGKNLYDFSLLEDQAHILDQLALLTEQEDIDAVVIAGDVYDRPVPAASAILLYDNFLSHLAGDLHIPVLAIAGNHDSPTRLGFGSSLYQRSGYHISGVVGLKPHTVLLQDEWGDVCFLLLPFLHIADVRALFPDEQVHTFDDAYRVLLAEYCNALPKHTRCVAVAHGFFGAIGSALTEQPLITSDSEIGVGGMDIVDIAHFSTFNYVALGHLHAPQKVGENACYSGSPLKYSLSEEHQRKSATIVDLGKDGVEEIYELPLTALRDVRTVSGTLEELMEPCFHENTAFGDYVFADIAGDESPFPMQKLRTLFPHLLGLRFLRQAELAGLSVPAPTAAKKLEHSTTEELFQRFYRDCTGQDLPEDSLSLLRAVLEDVKKEEAL